jgi:diphthamide biosynthesis methyltransferase
MLSKERTMMFERNESALDRVARLVVGGGLVAVSVTSLGVSSAKPLGILVGVIGAVLVFTAATGSCLLYRLVGVNTCSTCKQS